MQLGLLFRQAARQVSLGALKALSLLVLAAVLTLVLLVTTGTGRVWSAHIMIALINQSVPWHLEVQSIQSHNLGHWEVERIRLYDPEQNEPWLNLAELELQFPWRQSLHHWHLETLTLGRADINLDQRTPATESQPVTWPESGPNLGLQLEHLNIDELTVRQQGQQLSGAVQAQLNWQPNMPLPELTLSWVQANAFSLGMTGTPSTEQWQLRGQFTQPAPWDDPRHWPQDQPLEGHFALDVIMAEQRINLSKLTLDGWFAPIRLRAEMQARNQQWQIDPFQLQIGESVSEFTLQQTEAGLSLKSDWQIPLGLVMPWLPDEIGAGWDDPDAMISGALRLSAEQSWQISGGVHSQWQGESAVIEFTGSGQGLRIDEALFDANLGGSQFNLTGYWQPESATSELAFEGLIQAPWLPTYDAIAAPESLQLQGRIILYDGLAALSRPPQWAAWHLDNLSLQWPADSLLSHPAQLSVLGSGQVMGRLADLNLQGQWQVDFITPEHSIHAELAGQWRPDSHHLIAQLETDYAGHPVSAQLRWHDTELRSRVLWQDRTLDLTGERPLAPDAHWILHVQNIRDTDIAPWISLPEGFPELEAQHELELQWQGRTEAADIQFTSSHRGTWDQAPIQASAQGSAQFRAGQLTRWQIDPLWVHWQDATLMIRAENQQASWLPEQFFMTLEAVPLNLLWPDLDGVINGRVELGSEQTDWLGAIQLDVQGQRESDLLSGQIALTAQGRNLELRTLDVQRLALGYGDSFAIAGQGGLAEQQWDLRLNWRGLEWTPPQTWLLPAAPWRAQGNLHVQGESDNPDIDLEQQWDAIWMTPDGVSVPWQLRQHIMSETTEYRLNNTLSAAGNEQLNLIVELPRTSWLDRIQEPWSEWPWQASAYWSSALADWFTWLDIDTAFADGTLVGEAYWQGPYNELAYQIDAEWQGGSLQLPILGLEARDLNVAMSLAQDQRLTLAGTGHFGDGRIDWRGSLDPSEQPWPISAQIDLQQATLLQRPEVQSAATGQLEVAGTWPELLLSGDLALNELEVNLNRMVGSNIPQLEIHNEPQVEPPLWPLTMDIGITTAGFARISGNGLTAQLSGDVRLLGTPDAINTEGALTIESGQFNLLTRNFVLTEGQLRLIDETIHLNIVATHQRGDVMIEAMLRGPIDALELSLRSDPVLPEDEIVAQLLFGKAVQNMTPWQALQLASAINQLRGGESLDLLLATRDTLGLDTLEIETTEDEEAPAILRIGRYLNSRVYLELDTELDAERSLSGRVEVELTPNLFLETQTGGSGGRFHLRWRRDY